MATEKIVMSVKDVVRYELLNEVLRGTRQGEEVAVLLGVSERTVRRKTCKVAAEGLRGIIHGNTKREPVNKRSVAECERILLLIRQKYFDFNVSHARDFLFSEEGIKISYGSLRDLMRMIGPLKKAKRRPRKRREHRDRMPRFGMLLQMDGSSHRWNGKDIWCMIGCIDDATSYIPYAELFNSETTLNCMNVLQRIIEKHGIPQFLYVDRAGLYGGHKRQEFSQFKRACGELGIKIIFANSPQAKGRIERAWGTMQDRLVAELRLHNISAQADANRYLREQFLPDYWNKELTVKPEQSESGFRRVPEGINLDEVFSIRFIRSIANNNTVSIGGDRFRIKAVTENRIPVCARAEIVISQDQKMCAKIRGEKYPLEKIKVPPKEPMRPEALMAKSTVSECSEQEAETVQRKNQGRRKNATEQVSHGSDVNHISSNKSQQPPQGAKNGDEFISVLNPRRLHSKKRFGRAA